MNNNFYIPVVSVFLVLIFSCSSPIPAKAPVVKSDTNAVAHDAGNECIFDTSTYKFTTEAIKKFNPQLSFHWVASDQVAFFSINDKDSMQLHIGGCTHFSYEATYITDADRYDDEAFIVAKAKWMAQHFFDKGFSDKYVDLISKKLYTQKNGAAPFTKLYSMQDPDTTEVMQVYEGWLVEKRNNRTIINLSGYVN